MEAENESEAFPERGKSSVDTHREPVAGPQVGVEPVARPGEGTIESGRGHDADAETVIERHRVFGSCRHGAGKHIVPFPVRGCPVEFIEILKTFAEGIELLIKAVFLVTVDSYVLESVEYPALLSGLSQRAVLPGNETQVADSQRESQASDEFEIGSEVEGGPVA